MIVIILLLYILCFFNPPEIYKQPRPNISQGMNATVKPHANKSVHHALSKHSLASVSKHSCVYMHIPWWIQSKATGCQWPAPQSWGLAGTRGQGTARTPFQRPQGTGCRWGCGLRMAGSGTDSEHQWKNCSYPLLMCQVMWCTIISLCLPCCVHEWT